MVEVIHFYIDCHVITIFIKR